MHPKGNWSKTTEKAIIKTMSKVIMWLDKV